jgi:aspartate carbamoyltransferase catalytic subunit
MSSFPSLLESIEDLSFDQIQSLLSRARHFKNHPNELPPFANTYPKPIIATSFLENSTRTKHSFAIAVERLGGKYLDFNAETSSLKKGESLEETFLTLHYQGVDLCVFRTSISHQLNQFKEHPPIKLVNGGDGINEHPTQALLDIFTLLELSPDLNGKTITILGDLVHSRVGHSLLKLLPQFGLNVLLYGPEEFLPADYSQRLSREEVIKKSDFLYLLRIQKERHANANKTSMENYLEEHGISLELLKKQNKLIPVLHPGPANIGVEIDQSLIKSSLYKGYLQVENSIPVRMAILEAMLLNRDKNIGCINGEKL